MISRRQFLGLGVGLGTTALLGIKTPKTWTTKRETRNLQPQDIFFTLLNGEWIPQTLTLEAFVSCWLISEKTEIKLKLVSGSKEGLVIETLKRYPNAAIIQLNDTKNIFCYDRDATHQNTWHEMYWNENHWEHTTDLILL